MIEEVYMKSVVRSLTLAGIICSVAELAYATPIRTPCITGACKVRGAPGPEIGDGMVGFAVAAALLFTVLMIPRIKGLLQTKTA